MSLFSFFRGLAKPIAHILYRLKHEGAENVPLTGRVILASNHQHAVDPGLIGVGIKRDFFAMAKNELFDKRVSGKLLTKLGAFPTKRTISDVSAIRHAVSLLEQDKCMLIFPEGKRCPDDPLERIKSGAVAIAYLSRSPIVPVAVCAPEGTRLGKRVIVRYGKPIPYEEFGITKLNSKNLRAANELLLARMKELHDD